MDNTYFKIDSETGELMPVKAVELQPGDYVRRKAQNDYYIKKQERNSDKTAFVWVLFVYGKELLPDISDANITRLMYAATFCNDDNSLMSKSALKATMNLKKTSWNEFWNEMLDNNILYENNEIVYINDELFAKGKIKTDINRTRMFCDCVQYLYESCDSANDHKQLSYLFKIIPFVNRGTNIVCHNPQELEKKKISPMNLGQFCDIIGYDKSHARRLAKDLLSIKINKESAIGFFVQDLKEETWSIIINPKLYFGGDRTTLAFKSQVNLFQIDNEKLEISENMWYNTK